MFLFACFVLLIYYERVIIFFRVLACENLLTILPIGLSFLPLPHVASGDTSR